MTFYCDRQNETAVSTMWIGSNYYRFLPPAGSMMPVAPTAQYSCGSRAPVWLNGQHPSVPFDEVGATL